MKVHTEEVWSARKKGGGYHLNATTGKRERQLVCKVDFNQYDSFEELIKSEGEANVLKYSNAQIATNAKNKARAEAVGSVSETELTRLAMLRITQPENMAKLIAAQTQAAGDIKLYESLFNQIVAEMVAQIKAEKNISDEGDDEAAA